MVAKENHERKEDSVEDEGVIDTKEEDWIEMSQCSGFTVQELEAAERSCVSALCKVHGIDAECLWTDRTRMRQGWSRAVEQGRGQGWPGAPAVAGNI